MPLHPALADGATFSRPAGSNGIESEESPRRSRAGRCSRCSGCRLLRANCHRDAAKERAGNEAKDHDCRDGMGARALFRAVEGGHVKMIRLLLKREQYAPDAALLRAVPRIIVASAIMGGVLWTLAYALQPYLARSSGALVQLISLSALVGVGVITYFVLCHVLGAARLNQLVAMMRRGG